MTQIHLRAQSPSHTAPQSSPTPPPPEPDDTPAGAFAFECPFTSCRPRHAAPKTFGNRYSARRHLKNLHLKSVPLLAAGTSAQLNILRFRLDEVGMAVCERCKRIQGQQCSAMSCIYTQRPRIARSPVWRGDVLAAPTRTAVATELRTASTVSCATNASSAPSAPTPAPLRELPALVDILLTPLRTADINI